MNNMDEKDNSELALEKLKSILDELNQVKNICINTISDSIIEEGSAQIDISDCLDSLSIIGVVKEALLCLQEILKILDFNSPREKKAEETDSEPQENAVSELMTEMLLEFAWNKLLIREGITPDMLSDAYQIASQRKKNLLGETMIANLSLNFTNGDSLTDDDDFVISLFYDEKTDRALLVREWPDEGGTTFNVIVNYDKLKRNAPKSLLKMLKNGLKRCEEWI